MSPLGRALLILGFLVIAAPAAEAQSWICRYSTWQWADVGGSLFYSTSRNLLLANASSCRKAIPSSEFAMDCIQFAGDRCTKRNENLRSQGHLNLPPSFCDEGNHQFSKALDIGDGCDFCVFESELEKALRSEAVATYLKDLRQALDGTGKINLYTFTLNHPIVHGDKELATALIAVLFQDTKSKHLTRRFVSEPNFFLTYSAIADIVKAKKEGRITFFPPPVPEIDSSPYHFYVSAHLAQRMQRQGARPEQAYLFPSMMNSDYETIHNAMSPLYWVNSTGADKQKHDEQQIFLGSEGAKFGLNKSAPETSPAAYESFQKKKNISDYFYSQMKSVSRLGKP